MGFLANILLLCSFLFTPFLFANAYPSLFVSVNQSKTESGDLDKLKRDGFGLEGGARFTIDNLSLESYAKTVSFKEIETKKTGESNELDFDDYILGFGMRFHLELLTSRFGYAFHKYKLEKYHNDSFSDELSDKGNDNGSYFGLGFNIPGPSWSLFGDYTRFRLFENKYKIDDISFGISYRIGFLSSK